jgi:uncharacterized protein with HEPN domain
MPHRDRRNNVIRVRHMLDFARKAVDFNKDKNRADLDANEMLALATVHLVELMCNAAQLVTAEFRGRYQDVPWAQIAATKDRLGQGDGEVDLDVIWAIVNRDLPPLITHLRRIIREEG